MGLFYLLLASLLFVTKPVTNEPVATASYTFETTAQGGLVVVLDGSASKDPDGYIVSYQWSQIGASPNRATISQPNTAVTPVAPANWVLGTYKFRLKVTDNRGGTGTSTVTVTVKH